MRAEPGGTRTNESEPVCLDEVLVTPGETVELLVVPLSPGVEDLLVTAWCELTQLSLLSDRPIAEPEAALTVVAVTLDISLGQTLLIPGVTGKYVYLPHSLPSYPGSTRIPPKDRQNIPQKSETILVQFKGKKVSN